MAADEIRGEAHPEGSNRNPPSKFMIFENEFVKDMHTNFESVSSGFRKAKSKEKAVYDQAVADIDMSIELIKAELMEFERMYGIRKDYLSYLNEAEKARQGLSFETRNPTTDHSLRISDTQLTENLLPPINPYQDDPPPPAFDDQDDPPPPKNTNLHTSTDLTQKTAVLSTSKLDLAQKTGLSTTNLTQNTGLSSSTESNMQNRDTSTEQNRDTSTDLTQKTQSDLTQNTALPTSTESNVQNRDTDPNMENLHPVQNVENQHADQNVENTRQRKKQITRTTTIMTRKQQKIVDARTRLQKMAVAAESESARLANTRSTSKTTRRKSRVQVVPQIQLNEQNLNNQQDQQQNPLNQQNLLNEQNLLNQQNQPIQQQNLLNEENLLNQQNQPIQQQNLLNEQNLLNQQNQPIQQQNLLNEQNLLNQQQNLEDNLDVEDNNLIPDDPEDPPRIPDDPEDPLTLEVTVPSFPQQLFDLLNSNPGYIKWFGVASFVVPSINAFNQQHNPAVIGNWEAIKQKLRNH
ncbi:hypothetical protein MKW92_049951, partial [Papaver armeniacum]